MLNPIMILEIAYKKLKIQWKLKLNQATVEALDDRLTLAEEDIDFLQNDMAAFVNTSKDAALKSEENTFTQSNTFSGGIILKDNELVLSGDSRISDATTGNTILKSITVDSNTQQAYLGLHEVWIKGPDEILLESENIKTKRRLEDGTWVEYTNVDSGNINDYVEAGISEAELTNTLKDYVTTDQTIELITNHIDVNELAKEVTIDSPSTAIEGTLTIDQLDILTSGDSNFIMFNNEKYYLNDKGHEEGFLTYSHTGYSNGTNIIKTITITISTRGWTLNSSELNNASIKYVTISAPSGATEGTFTAEEVSILQSSKSNRIIFDNEIYILQDAQHEDGYFIYSHVGHNSANDFMVKCIILTLSTGAWVLTTQQINNNSTSPKIYKHSVSVGNADSVWPKLQQFTFYSYLNTPISIIDNNETPTSANLLPLLEGWGHKGSYTDDDIGILEYSCNVAMYKTSSASIRYRLAFMVFDPSAGWSTYSDTLDDIGFSDTVTEVI